jgi:hypothetical protein
MCSPQRLLFGLLTEWNEYRAIDLAEVRRRMCGDVWWTV